MKKFLLLFVMCSFLFLNGCTQNLSNIDIQKLNQKAAEYMEAGEYEKAVARLESSLDLNSNFPETYYNLGVAYFQLNDYEKSLEALNNAIAKKENFADAYYSRAVVYENWAYSIIEGENLADSKKEKNKEQISKEDKNTSVEYLKNAKKDLEKYLELKKDAKDKDEVHEKIIQIENDLSNYDSENIED